MAYDPLVFAYMAGMIDGDGFISVTIRNYPKKSYYRPIIGIGGTDDAPHKLAKSLWGGSCFVYHPKNPNHRVQYLWQCVGAAAAKAISDIFPYLRIKGDNALNALELWEHLEDGRVMKDNPYPWFSDSFNPDQRSYDYYTEAKRLNFRKNFHNRNPETLGA